MGSTDSCSTDSCPPCEPVAWPGQERFSHTCMAVMIITDLLVLPIAFLAVCRRAQAAPGKKVAILGAGPIGLITAIVAAAFGADTIAITDISSTKLGFASQHCPRVHPLLISPKDSPSEVAAQLQQKCFGGAAPEVVIDCAGFQQTLETGLRVVAAGGRVVLVGMGQEHMTIPATLLTVKEVDLLGSFR